MNLEMSRLAARKIRREPALFAQVLETLQRWKRLQHPAPPALLEWDRILRQNSPQKVLAMLTQDNEEGNRLRQSDPFTNIVGQRERLRIFKRYAKG